jgi:hypothetical protein
MKFRRFIYAGIGLAIAPATTSFGSLQTIRPTDPLQPEPYDLKEWPVGKSPEEIGLRITNKYLSLPHSHWGKYRKKANRITYPDVCTWLGGLWFAEATNNEYLLNRLEERFLPLYGDEKHMLPTPDHVDNNVFGAVPLELYLQGKCKPYLELASPSQADDITSIQYQVVDLNDQSLTVDISNGSGWWRFEYIKVETSVGTGVDDIDKTAISGIAEKNTIHTLDRTIFINSDVVSRTLVADITGRIVAQTYEKKIPVPQPGIYIVVV